MLNFAPANLTETRQVILTTLKRRGPVTIDMIARRLRLTHEAVRQHVVQLRRQGWVEECKPRETPVRREGRPAQRYCLSMAGEHLFPKHYDQLTLDLLEAASRTFGRRAVLDLFAAMANETVAKLKRSVQGKSLREKLEILSHYYARVDRATLVDAAEGDFRLIERNCPFLNVALERPELCSVTVNVLTRILGRKVVRTERYQNGDGRCVFQILNDEPTRLNRFALEPAAP